MQSFIQFTRNSLFYIISKIFFGNKVRIIKCIPRIINKGNLSFGRNFTAGKDLRIEVLSKHAKVIIEENVKVNDYFHLGCINEISIGKNTLIGSRVSIVDHNHGIYGSEDKHSAPYELPDLRVLNGSAIRIGENVWIAEGVVILPGVNIGDGCVIGANSVVSKNIESFTLAAGIPAKPIKKYNRDSSKWEIV